MRSLDKLDPILVPLLLSSQAQIQTEPVRNIDALELFCGVRSITKAAAHVGLVALGFDKLDGPAKENNILYNEGYEKALQLVLAVKPGGFVWAAPECTSWVWVSRRSTGRSQFLPDGDVWKSEIDEANRMVARLTSLLLLAWSRHVHVFVEQPVSSVMNYISPLEEFIKCCLICGTCLWLGSYGALTEKPLKIWSTAKEVVGLKLAKPKGKTRLVHKKGGRAYGKPDELKASSAYPVRFGLKVAEIYLAILHSNSLSHFFDTDLAEMLAAEIAEETGERPVVEKKKPKKRKQRP